MDLFLKVSTYKNLLPVLKSLPETMAYTLNVIYFIPREKKAWDNDGKMFVIVLWNYTRTDFAEVKTSKGKSILIKAVVVPILSEYI